MTSIPPQGPWDAPPGSGQPYGGGWPPGGSLPSYPGGTGPEGNWGPPTGVQLAGWWYRVGATVIDGLILGIIGLVFQLLLGRVGGELVNFVIEAIYLIVLVGGSGQTIGCRALGTKVVAADGRSQVGYGKAAVRWIVQIILFVLFFIPGLIDLLWPLWDDKNQSLHDKAAGTLVVRVR